MVYRLQIWVHSLYKLEIIKVFFGVAGWSSSWNRVPNKEGFFHVFLEKKLRFKIITKTISANHALDKTFAFTIIKNWLLQGGNHIDVHHGRCAWRETFCNGVELSLLFVSVKIYFQNIIPGIEKKPRHLAAIGLVSFCHIVCSLSLWVCVESRRDILLMQFCAKTLKTSDFFLNIIFEN